MKKAVSHAETLPSLDADFGDDNEDVNWCVRGCEARGGPGRPTCGVSVAPGADGAMPVVGRRLPPPTLRRSTPEFSAREHVSLPRFSVKSDARFVLSHFCFYFAIFGFYSKCICERYLYIRNNWILTV